MTQTITRKLCPRALSKQLFFLCCATYIIGAFGRLSYSAVMVELIASGQMDKAQAGLIGTAMFLVYGVFQLISGIVGDRVSPKKMLFAGVLGSGLVNLCMGLTGQYAVMLVLWSLNGVFQSLLWSPVARIFAETLAPDSRKRAASNAAATYPIATVLAYVMASVLLAALGWRSVFLISSAMMAVMSVFWYVRMSWLERQIETSEETEIIEIDEHHEAEKKGLFALLLTSGVLFALIPSLTHGMLRDGIQTWLPSLMTENFHFGTSASVAMAIFLPIVNICGVFITKAIAKRHIGNELHGAGGFFLCAIVMLTALAFVCNTSALASLLLLTVASTCMVGVNIMLINLMPIYFGMYGRTSSMTGILNCSAYVGSAISSFGIGAAAESFGWTAAIWIWVGFSVAAFLLAIAGTAPWGRFIRKV